MKLTQTSMATQVPEAVSSLAVWAEAGVFGSAEVHGAAVLSRADPAAEDSVHLAAALALWAPLHGHACIDLADVATVVESALAAAADLDQRDAPALPWPPLDEWLSALHATDICRTVPAADPAPVLDHRPLVLCGAMLYTQRQWVDECIVAADLRRRSAAPPATIPPSSSDVLERLLPAVEDGRRNLQHDAARLALQAKLAIIVGGPGTGKTHTIARLLAVSAHRAEAEGRVLRIALAAPTGKAAARMGEALGTALTGFGSVGTTVIDQLAALRPTTIHRLLGSRGQQRTRFAHDAERPLDHDIVVIDEASMLALPLMARLVEALRPETSLILVGDPDQLESIEVGSVLADIVVAGSAAASPLAGRVIRLDRPRRQALGSPIGPLADAIRAGDAEGVLRLLGRAAPDGVDAPITFLDTEASTAAAIDAAIRNAVIPRFEAAVAAARVGHAADALAQFADVRVLCAHRTGPFGVERWNRLVESWLLAQTSRARPPRYYPGRPLLATRNDPRQRILNGDTGIIVDTDAGLRAAFATSEGIRLLAPAQLDTVDTAFAMTIHKSQGSEYETVVVVLPPAGSPLIGRELLYTAITRSTTRLFVVGTRAAVVAAVTTPGRRVTGLAAALA